MLLPKAQKQSSFLLTLIAAVIAGAGIAASLFVYAVVDKQGREHILDRANTVARAVPLEEFRALTGTEADLSTTSEAYARLKSLLVDERAVNRDVRFIYLLGKNADNTLFFYLDSEDPSSVDYSPPGQEYPEATETMHAFFENGESVVEGPDRDRWGLWISGYAPIKDEEGRVLALLGIDLPAQQFLTDALIYSLLPLLVALIFMLLLLAAAHAYRREQERIYQREEFLSIASHEIRTPMTGISWGIESILRTPDGLPPASAELLSLIHENAQNLLARLNNLLDVATLDTKGSKGLSRERIDVDALLTDIMTSLSLAAKKRGVTLVPPTTKAVIEADGQMMHHAFFNLIGNAVKYTTEGTEVRVLYKKEGDMHVFRVEDHGKGIAPEDRERIFAGYTRTESARASGVAGTGLGLYLTRKAVELHGGSVVVTETNGGGTTFVISLPA